MYLQWGHGDKVQKGRMKCLCLPGVALSGDRLRRGDGVDGGQGSHVFIMSAHDYSACLYIS